MLLYHGSDHVIEKPEFGAGKKHNDYGKGFYCTENIELAKEWAVSEDADGYVNKYSIDTSKLEVLDINSGMLVLCKKPKSVWIPLIVQ